ncbi:MAG: hypothetical protein K0R14_1142 [Burkholderiales bacterium]|jgi:hypothetical protein|nr:hypothetical protein [Burkholderiales bacterium]
MQILVSVFSTFLGVFIGAWVNNIFTWRIKGQVEMLDTLADEGWKLMAIYTLTEEHKTKSNNEYKNLLEESFVKIQSKLEILNIEELKHHINMSVKNKAALISNCNKFLDNVQKYRRKITSFGYMLKELYPFKFSNTRFC